MTTNLSSFAQVEAKPEKQIVTIADNDPFVFENVTQVYSYNTDHIVYRVGESKLEYLVTNKIDDTNKDICDYWIKVQKAISIPRHNVRSSEKSILSSLANGISSALCNRFVDANTYLEDALRKLKQDSTRRIKTFYIPAALLTTGICIAIGVYLTSGYTNESFASENSLKRIYATSVLGGAVGAFLSSVMMRSGDHPFDPLSKPGWAVADGISRGIYGIVSAFLLILAFDLGVFSSNIIPDDKDMYAYIFVGAIGGFLERKAADIIRVFKSDETVETPG